MNGGQPILQSLAQVIVVKFLSESAEWRRIRMWTSTCRPHGMTPRAQRLEEVSTSLQFVIEGVGAAAPCDHQQQRAAEFVHDHLSRGRVGPCAIPSIRSFAFLERARNICTHARNDAGDDLHGGACRPAEA